MTGKLAVAMLLVLVAMSDPWTRASARPLQGDQVHAGEPSAGGSVDIALPLPTHWRGRVLSQLEKGPNGCPKSSDPNNHCSLP
ncbi:hypothetical protein ZWY2020_022557 [Hordeum vulgare]|nr:hypothetical protein ZWY2020_022557 [Hordeum vulgare]